MHTAKLGDRVRVQYSRIDKLNPARLLSPKVLEFTTGSGDLMPGLSSGDHPARSGGAFVLDIDHIRAELNELPFKDGKREVLLGRISEMFVEESEQSIADHLRKYEGELRNHMLILSRHEDDRNALFVVQKLRWLALDFSWMAEATNWVSKITVVVLQMILPGLAGLWLDNRLGTGFLALLGFALGVPLGIRHLIAMTKSNRNDIE
jgi:hypothetical protein